MNYTDFSEDFLSANPGLTSNGMVIKLTYRVTVSEWWSSHPDMQYILQPNKSGKNAFVLGLRVELTF
jgi:carbohydrate-selective porin OprB